MLCRSVTVVALIVQGLAIVSAIQREATPPKNITDETTIYKRLWDGKDLNTDEFDGIDLPILEQHIDGANYSGLKYQIAGPFDSGTNLMEAMIAMNFPSAFKWPKGQRKLWKHSVSGSGAFTKQFRSLGYDSSNFVVIAMVRDPLSLLASWKKAPYDLKQCVKDWDDVLKTCKGYMRARTCFCTPFDEKGSFPHYFRRFSDAIHRFSQGPISFHSIADLFENYFQQYHMLAKENAFAKVEIVHYEDLVRHPEMVMKRIGNALGVPTPDKIAIVDSPAKTHGNPVGYDAAVMKLHEKAWLKEIPSAVQKSFCSSLSEDIKVEYSLQDCA